MGQKERENRGAFSSLVQLTLVPAIVKLPSQEKTETNRFRCIEHWRIVVDGACTARGLEKPPPGFQHRTAVLLLLLLPLVHGLTFSSFSDPGLSFSPTAPSALFFHAKKGRGF